MSSSQLVPYRPSSTQIVATSSHTSLIPSHLFSAQTGHAIATELLYRLLIDILNRLLVSLHRFAAHRLDTFSSFLERKYSEREAARKEALEQVRDTLGKGDRNEGGLRISDEVTKAARRRGFVADCPMTGQEAGTGGGKPPGWVGQVLVGIEQGRLVERDFWGHPFGN